LREAERFPNTEILPTLSAKLSWSHILELLPLKTVESQLYYAQEVAARNWGVHELRRQISRKAYERRKSLPGSAIQREIDYFIEPKDDDDE
jgi:hypothetical protein